MIKKAFILAAGLGTRLGRYTEKQPKALMQVLGVPMLERVIENLKQQGIEHFLVNVHHHALQVMGFIEAKKKFGVRVTLSDESGLLLDTGGAILKASHFFKGDDPVLVHNVDVLSAVDLDALERLHHNERALATLCVRKRPSGRYLLFDPNMCLRGWKDNRKNTFRWVGRPADDYRSYAFSGIYLAGEDFVKKLGFAGRFSIIDAWLNMASHGKIRGYVDPSPFWFDLGTPERIREAEEYLRQAEK